MYRSIITINAANAIINVNDFTVQVTHMPQLLPITTEEMQSRGWDCVDFVCVTGDSYVDHPSFGVAVISRLLESLGFRAAVLPQPQSDGDYTRFGRPKLGFMVTGGNIDSMVAHYTAAKRGRSDDSYTAGNKAGKRPDRAVTVYTKKLKALFPGCPVVIGGLEASFRRFAHYDYWDDAVRPSVLAESGADLLVYGMGELAVREIAARLKAGESPESMTNIRGTCFLGTAADIPKNSATCASLQKVAQDKAAFARSYKIQLDEQDYVRGKAVVQRHGEMYLIQNPPMRPLIESELDDVFALPYTREYHPSYEKFGGVKALEEVAHSIICNRGCFGGCNFCSIAFHQGRFVVSRSKDSVLNEAGVITRSPGFKGYIHDVGGPTANFSENSCDKQRERGMCRDKKCLAPAPCPNLKISHAKYLDIRRALREVPRVKRIFVRSGLRFDYINLDKDKSFLRELVRHHVSGQLKVAPEHNSQTVLDLMGKPRISAFETFRKNFFEETKRAKKEQYLVPYLMSSHPGATLTDAVNLALWLKKNNMRPQQVQDFYPTPGTASTAMFYTGLNPFTMKPVHIPRSAEEKAMQRALLQYFDPANHELARKALRKAGRADLIGALVPRGKKIDKK
jgi:uncharacterized radical SAM protein YgiQ